MDASPQSAPNRRVISWFGYDIRDYELLEETDLRNHINSVVRLSRFLGLQVERCGNNLDLIIGRIGYSLNPWDFFRFQKSWDRLNESLGFRMSGMLWLMNVNHTCDPLWPRETYKLGIKTFGESIGRPLRHSLEATRK